MTYKCTTSFLHLLLHTKQHYKIRLYCWKKIIKKKKHLNLFKTVANTSLSTEVIRLFTYCKLPLKVLGLYNVLRVTPYKGIQDCLGFWIPGTGFQYLTIELGVWISTVGGIPDSSALFRNHKQKFPEFWNSLYGAIRGHRRDLKRGGGGLYSAGLITGLKQHFKTNSSADQNTSCIHSRFYASKRWKNQFNTS